MGRLLVVLFVIALITVVVIGMMLAAKRRPKQPVQENPREILKRRYAAGEIDEDEYLRRMSGLNQDW